MPLPNFVTFVCNFGSLWHEAARSLVQHTTTWTATHRLTRLRQIKTATAPTPPPLPQVFRQPALACMAWRLAPRAEAFPRLGLQCTRFAGPSAAQTWTSWLDSTPPQPMGSTLYLYLQVGPNLEGNSLFLKKYFFKKILTPVQSIQDFRKKLRTGLA